MSNFRLYLLLFSLAFLEDVAAFLPKVPKRFVPLCAHDCLNKAVPKLCPHRTTFKQLNHCLCQPQISKQLDTQLANCLYHDSNCTESDIAKTLKFTQVVCGNTGGSTPTSPNTHSSTPSPTPSSQPAQSATHHKGNTSSGLSKGAAAGIGVGVAVAVLTIIVLFIYLLFKRRRQQRLQQQQTAKKEENEQDVQNNTQERDLTRAELSASNPEKPIQEAPPAYRHETEGTPISELASPGAEANRPAIGSQIYELASHSNPSLSENAHA